MGLELAWHATHKFSIEGEATSTLPFSSMPWIVTAQVGLGSTRFGNRANFTWMDLLVAAYEKISFKDNQTVSNDINMDFGPMLMLGLELRF